MKKSKLSELGEFGLIRQIRDICITNTGAVQLGIGDDSAAVKSGSKTTLLSSDMLVEGIHFDIKTTSFRQLGHKILAVNLSDVFAMGGRPRHFLLNIAVPKRCSPGDIKDIYRGMKALSERYDVSVVGGDTTSSGRDLILSGTIIGDAGRVISRKGAMPGDNIFVTGTLGDSAMGLQIMMRSKFKNKSSKLRKDFYSLCKKHLEPEPRPLRRTKDITAMIDISDGLLADLGHICDESGVGALLYEDLVPTSKELLAVSKVLGKDPMEYALKGGEDFVLLFTSSAKSKKGAVKIGEITKSGRYIIDRLGKKMHFRAEGYEHFKKGN